MGKSLTYGPGTDEVDTPVEAAAQLDDLEDQGFYKGEPERQLFISEGVRVEIEQNGKALDPVTGKFVTKDDLDAWSRDQSARRHPSNQSGVDE